MKINVWSECGFVGCDRKDVIEVDDDATDEEIEEEARDWFFNRNSFGWDKEEESA